MGNDVILDCRYRKLLIHATRNQYSMLVKKTRKSESHEPLYIKGTQSGWNPSSRRWTSLNGKICTKEQAVAENKIRTEPDQFGGMVKGRFPAPITNNFEILELQMSSLDSNNPMVGISGVIKAAIDGSTNYKSRMEASYKSALKKWEDTDRRSMVSERNRLNAVQGLDPIPDNKPMPNYMPSPIQTRMNLAEHYYNTDGDATNIVDVPVELLARSIDVICTDTKMRKDIETFISDKNLEARVSELWSEQREYGQAYPLEVWGGNDLIDVVPMNPKSMHVGYNWTFGLTPEQYDTGEWSESLIESVFPPAMYLPLLRHWNDSPFSGPGQGLLIPGENMKPIWDRGRSWMLYSMPMLSKGFRELVDRTIYEDSVRALTEGYRYQLWVIKIGDKDRPPLPGEVAAAKSVLNGQAGDRTGMLVWRDPFTVEVHVPKGLQEMIANDYHGGITKQFYRKMGITSQVVSGEMPGSLGSSGGKGGGSSKGDIDVIIYLERCRYQAQQVTNWLTYLVKKWIRAHGTKYRVSALDTLKLSFMPTQTEMASLIKDVMGPMYRDGALSHRTYVSGAGLKSDVELEYKEEELKHREVLTPPVSYVQQVVDPSGEESTSAQTEPKGSPDKAGEENNDAKKRGTITVTKDEED